MGLIELIIIIWIVRVLIKKNQNKGKSKSKVGVPNRPNPPQKMPAYQNNAKQTVSQDELKRRLMEKYVGHTAKKPDILTKASANVAEDFKKEPVSRPDVPKMEKMAERQIVKRADALAEVDLDKIYDVSQIQQNSELMEKVSDIMAKGVDTKLTFERDFVAEGMDMISNLTL